MSYIYECVYCGKNSKKKQHFTVRSSKNIFLDKIVQLTISIVQLPGSFFQVYYVFMLLYTLLLYHVHGISFRSFPEALLLLQRQLEMLEKEMASIERNEGKIVKIVEVCKENG